MSIPAPASGPACSQCLETKLSEKRGPLAFLVRLNYVLRAGIRTLSLGECRKAFEALRVPDVGFSPYVRSSVDRCMIGTPHKRTTIHAHLGHVVGSLVLQPDEETSGFT